MSTRTNPTTQQAPDHRRGVLSALTEHWLPFLTAILGLATALAGFYATRTTTELNRSDAQVQQLSDANRRLTDTNQRLEADNSRLRQQLQEATTPTTSGTTPTSTPPSAEIFRQTGASPVVVRERFGIDLDTQTSNWGVSGTAPSDLYVSITRSVSGKKLAIVKEPPTQQVCEAQTVLQTYLTPAQTVVGRRLCVQTSEGRWAYVQIAAIDTSAEPRTMSFKIVVWKLPTDP